MKDQAQPANARAPKSATPRRRAPKTAPPSALEQTVALNLRKLSAVPRQLWEEFTYTWRHLPEVNFKQAERYAAEGRLRDAVFRLKVTLWLAPAHFRALALLARCYQSQGKKREAVVAFRQALKLNPNHAPTRFLLASIDANLLPEAMRPVEMPRDMVLEEFRATAPIYDQLQRQLGYQGHVLADEALRQHIDIRRTNHRVLDLGCGTGLLGALIQDVSGQLTGIDACREMLEFAMNRARRDGSPIYDRTLHRDVRDYLPEAKQATYDIIVASHLFPFLGPLDVLFPQICRVLLPGGLFIFHCELADAGVTVGVIAGAGRIGHSRAYIDQLIAASGLEVLDDRMVKVYPDRALRQLVCRQPLA